MFHQRGGTLLGLLFGAIVGVLISFGVVWYLNKTPLPFVEKVTKPETKSAGDAPLPLPGKPGDKPIEKGGDRKFEFYEILEGKGGAGTQGTAPAPDAPPPASSAVPAGRIWLQAGAFQKAADAENFKARLAILGFEAAVQAVEMPDKGTLHRVRVGPYVGEELNRARATLSQNGVPTTVVRIKE
jgi:cell division protein FtsN